VPDGPEDLRCDAARNRQRIVEAAKEVFGQRGVGLTVDEVAKRAGVGVGTVYRRFANKEALLDAIALPVFEQTLRIAERARREGEAEGFEWFVRRVVALYAGHGLPVRRLWGTAAGRSMRDRINPVVMGLIEGAHAAGTLRTDFRIEDVPVLVWTVTGLIEDTGGSAPAIWRRHLDLILDGLRTGDPRPLSAPPVPLERWARFAGGD
jgi:AcrR family transcriptional regulator